MRVALVLLALALAGCSSSEPSVQPEPAFPAPAEPPLPDDIHVEGQLGTSFDYLPTDVPACSAPGVCARHPFHLDGPATVTAWFHWSWDTDDYDLYLMQGDDVIDSSTAGLRTSEFLRLELAPGDYDLVVSGSLVTTDYVYSLDAYFDRPDAQAGAAPNP